ncbi:MAG: amidohydrolase family protein [Syntrophaceae bacterium]|nr:amidohydrolase family protein [Syntrophaceae bacterium]
MSSAKQRVIDFRLRPPEEEFKEEFPVESVVNNLRALGYKPAPSFMKRSKSLLLKEMDAAGVEVGVMNGIHWGDIHVTEEQVENVQKRYNGRMVSLAYANLTKPVKQILKEIETSVVKRGFKGVAIETFHVSMAVDDKRLFPIYEKCLDLGVFAHLMSGPIGSMPDLSYTDPIHYEHVALKYPDLKMVIFHACYPYVNQACAMVLRSIRQGTPNIYLEPDAFVFSPGGSVYVEAMNAYPDSFVFASAYPYGVIKEAVKQVNALPLDRKVRSKYLYDNALKLLKL